MNILAVHDFMRTPGGSIMPEINVAQLSDKQLKALIENHRARNATDRPVYAQALDELARRRGKGLSFQRSMEIIREAARTGRFLSYKELADASGATWNKVHYSVGGHLWDLVEYAQLRGWPMLSAIVVNKGNVDTGDMEPYTLTGFVNAARGLGLTVDDPDKFLREQQQRVFEWGRSHSEETTK